MMFTVFTNTTNPSSGVRLPFGVHNGKRICEVPESYLRMLVDGNDGVRYQWLIREIKDYLGTSDEVPDELHPHDYKSYVSQLSSRGNWFITPRVFLNVFAHDEAHLLCHLLNVSQVKSDADGWIPCLTSSLENDINLDLDDQKRILGSLQGLGVLEHAKRGNPPRRHVRINIHRIEELVEEAYP